MKKMASLFLVMCVLLSGCTQAQIGENEGVVSESAVRTEEQEIIFKKGDENNEKEPESEEETKGTEEAESPTVYRTKAGEKYHREGCYYLKSKIETTVAKATDMGLTPCSRCDPPRE